MAEAARIKKYSRDIRILCTQHDWKDCTAFPSCTFMLQCILCCILLFASYMHAYIL